MPEKPLDGKKALVTGASRGIGKAIALALAGAGADVACVASSEKNARETAAEVTACGVEGVAFGCRVENKGEVEAMFSQVSKKLGTVDILVNNAGIARPTPVLEMEEKDWDEVMDINGKGVFLCSQAFARQASGGSVINIGSIAGLNAFPNRLAYGASKATVHHMTRIMSLEWAPLNIRVNAIAPGYIMTEMVSDIIAAGTLDKAKLENRIPQGRLGSVEDIAKATLFLAGDNSRYITGSVITVDGGFVAYGFL